MPPHETSHSDADRISRLEELLTHFERTIEDLNDVVLSQHKRIDELDRRIADVIRRLKQLIEVQEQGPAEELPP